MANYWDNCDHQWRENTSDNIADGKSGCTQMVCEKCKVSGERDDATGEVYWPCT